MPLVTTRPYTIVCDSRDVLILRFELPTHPAPCSAQTAVLWDADRDERITLVLEALRFRDPRILAQILGVAEHQGKIDFWCTGNTGECRNALSAAADAALRPADRWTVNAPKVVNILSDRANLPADDPLRLVPDRFALGVVRS